MTATITSSSDVAIVHAAGNPTAMHLVVDGREVIVLSTPAAARRLLHAAVEAVGRLDDAAERELAAGRPRGGARFEVQPAATS